MACVPFFLEGQLIQLEVIQEESFFDRTSVVALKKMLPRLRTGRQHDKSGVALGAERSNLTTIRK